MSNYPERVYVWDGWRGLAILLVLVGHFTNSYWIWEERLGVDVFFVLSGMLMSGILFERRMALRDFYIRRFSRIMPALIIFLCFAYGLAYLKSFDFHFLEVITSVLFLRSYFPAEPYIVQTAVPIGHLWSLNVEEHSYVLMSIMSIVLVSKRYISGVLMTIFLGSIAICFHNYLTMSDEAFRLSLFRTETTIGFIAFSAGYHLIRKQAAIELGPYASIICLVVASMCYLEKAPLWLTFTVSPILLGIAINHLTESGGALRMLLQNSIMRRLGIISFSVYLWQQVFYMYWYAMPGGKIAGFFVSILLGALSFYLIEDPLRKALNRRWSPTPSYRCKKPAPTVAGVQIENYQQATR